MSPMKPGDRLTLLFDENGFFVRTSAPYTLAAALSHIEGVAIAARHLHVVVVEVVSAEAALKRASRDTMPAPPPLEESLADGTVSSPEQEHE